MELNTARDRAWLNARIPDRQIKDDLFNLPGQIKTYLCNCTLILFYYFNSIQLVGTDILQISKWGKNCSFARLEVEPRTSVINC